MPNLIDLSAAIIFLKKLNTPFTSFPAYKVGLIDQNGHFLKKPTTLRERTSLSAMDVIVINLKKLLAKLPGGASRLGTIAASLLLLREQNLDPNNMETLKEKLEEYQDFVIDIKFEHFLTEDIAPGMTPVGAGNQGTAMNALPSSRKLGRKSKRFVKEDGTSVAVNSVGSGNFAGLGVPAGSHFGEPPVRDPEWDRWRKHNKRGQKSFKEFIKTPIVMPLRSRVAPIAYGQLGNAG